MADQPDARALRRGRLAASAAGLDCLQSHVEALLAKIRRKYKEYGINEKPFVVVKADAGTSGMGIMTVRDAEGPGRAEPQRTQQAERVKDGQDVTEVIIQEGVPTYERMNDAVAEPVVYMIDRYVVGGFYRVHAERGIDENLNAPGLELRAAGLRRAATTCRGRGEKPGASAPNRFYMYGVIGRLAMLAASYELEATDPDAEVYDVSGGATPRSRCLTQRSDAQATNAHRSIAARTARSRLAVSTAPPPQRSPAALAALTLGALGVVYGDIGTSPLYALKEVFHGGHVPTTHGQHPRRAVADLLDDDHHRLAEVRAADPARRQQRRRRPDRDAGAGHAWR